MRSQLEQAAQRALAQNDTAFAARIYARMETLPEIVLIDGKPSGYSQTQLDSPRNQQALSRALEISATADDYLRMCDVMGRHRVVLAKLSHPLTDDDRQRLITSVAEVEKLWSEVGEGVWIVPRLTLAYDYARLGRHDDAAKVVDIVQRSDPRGEDYEIHRQSLQSRRTLDERAKAKQGIK